MLIPILEFTLSFLLVYPSPSSTTLTSNSVLTKPNLKACSPDTFFPLKLIVFEDVGAKDCSFVLCNWIELELTILE